MQSKAPAAGIFITVIILVLICLICLCLVLITGGVALLNNFYKNDTNTDSISAWTYDPTATPPSMPTPVPTRTPNANITTPITLNGASESLETLLSEVVPINDPIDLAERLGGKPDVPSTLPDQNAPYQVGDRKQFWISNTDNNQNFQVTAVLRYLGEHVYFWIEEGITYDNSDLNKLASTFDEEIVPTNRTFFGMEWSPGVDEDPRIYVLYARGLGSSVAGYYSSADQLHPDAHMYSNAHEMFLMNADSVDLGDDYIYGTMAHEFQHMIHWYKDRNEESWVNEGFSMLAELINEYDAGGFDYLYIMNPDLQLNDWGAETGENGPHYGASFLFMTYFLDRFGEEATKALVAHPENGMASIDLVMQELGLINQDTKQPYTAEEIFTDWALANYLLDSSLGEGQYDYQSYTPSRVNITDYIEACPEERTRDVFQFGVNYIEFSCPGTHTLTFTGAQQVKLLDLGTEHSGDYFFWSNMGDESNSRLSQDFDFSAISGPIEMTFKTSYDLETDYDYVFLSASGDSNVWQILNTSSCTTDNPSGNSYGCGYNGQSDGWIQERVDLSEFAGKKVTLRFDYVTDAAVNGTGFAIDDIEIPALGYVSDFETDDGGWDGEGFVRLQNILPQTFSVSFIEVGQEMRIRKLELSAENQGEFKFSINEETDKVILVVSGTTPITRQRAVYQYEIK